MKSARDQGWEDGSWLVGKLEPSRQNVPLARQSLLLQRVDTWLDHAVILVLSPAGFGKSTLLSQTLGVLSNHPGTTVAWLSLDEDDSEASRFIAGIVLALAHAGLDVGALRALSEGGLVDVEEKKILLSLLSRIADSDRHIVLMLDDYHRVRSADVDKVVERMLHGVIPNLHVVISARDRPRLQLSDLEARGLVLEIGSWDLVLSPEESATLIGSRLSDDEHGQLYAMTEGWPVAVQLARLWLDKMATRDVAPMLEGFARGGGQAARYLAEQVFEQLPGEAQDFLLSMSLFDRFSIDFADHVRDCTDSRALMDGLSSLEALLVPLDEGRGWYRFHALFADFLRHRLPGMPGVDVSALHRRAAIWLAANGDLIEAVRHAIEADGQDRGVDLLTDAGGWQIALRRGIGYVRGLLRSFSPEYTAHSSALLIIKSYVEIRSGDWLAARNCLQACDVDQMPENSPLQNDFTVMDTLLRSYTDDTRSSDDFVRTLQFAATAGLDSLNRGTVLAEASLSALALGKFVQALDISRHGEEAMRSADCIVGTTYCQFHRGQSHFHLGDWCEAERVYAEATLVSEESFGVDSSLRAIVGCLSAQLLYERNQLQEARELLEPALPTIESRDGWFDIFATAFQVAVRLDVLQFGSEAGLSRVQAAERVARTRGLKRLETLAGIWRREILDANLINEEEAVRSSRIQEQVPDVSQDPSQWRAQHAQARAMADAAIRAGNFSLALNIALEGKALSMGQCHRANAAAMDLRAAVALKGRGDVAAAFSHLEDALNFIATEDAVRMVLDMGPVIRPLLQQRLRQSAQADNEPMIAEFVQRVLTISLSSHAPSVHDLTLREDEILKILCEGRSNKEIGRALDISENTVKFHLKQIYRKLEVETRSAAVSAAQKRMRISLEN